jgi:large repetitive protein
MMRKTVAAVVAAGSLLAGSLLASSLLISIGAATPALAQSRPITLLCSPGSNGGTLVNGVCVLPAAAAGQPYEAFLLTSNGAVDTFTITNGSLPPGLSMPATYGAAGTIVGGTPTAQGTFTFTVHVTKFGTSTPSTNGTYRITVGPPPPLTVTFPSTCCNAGTVGSSYFQNFFTSGGVGPFTWTVSAGQLPPGVTLTGGHLGGTPTAAGTYTFTIKVTDSAGDQATEPGSITISP